jgi:hypothetical protein
MTLCLALEDEGCDPIGIDEVNDLVKIMLGTRFNTKSLTLHGLPIACQQPWEHTSFLA